MAETKQFSFRLPDEFAAELEARAEDAESSPGLHARKLLVEALIGSRPDSTSDTSKKNFQSSSAIPDNALITETIWATQVTTLSAIESAKADLASQFQLSLREIQAQLEIQRVATEERWAVALTLLKEISDVLESFKGGKRTASDASIHELKRLRIDFQTAVCLLLGLAGRVHDQAEATKIVKQNFPL